MSKVDFMEGEGSITEKQLFSSASDLTSRNFVTRYISTSFSIETFLPRVSVKLQGVWKKISGRTDRKRFRPVESKYFYLVFYTQIDCIFTIFKRISNQFLVFENIVIFFLYTIKRKS